MSNNKQIVFGIHAVNALLEHHPDRVSRIFIQRERRDNTVEAMAKLAAEHDISVEYLPKKEIDKLAHDANHQGVIA
jgi:23S rRNA (guanosine2251-2'-O)-methyltransferase